MDIQNSTSHSDAFLQNERERRERAEQTFWQMVATLWQRKYFIMGVAAIVAVLSVVVSLLLPVWYLGSARLLLPESSGGGGALSAVLQDLGPVAANLLGGDGGDTERYFSILTSHRVMNAVVEEFDLETVYELDPAPNVRNDAIEILRDNVAFGLDNEYGFMTVDVYDQDPQRAAAMANFFVAELNQVNNQLQAQSAAQYRQFMTQNLHATEQALDSARAALQRFQEEHGIIDLPIQTESFLQSMADLRTSVLQEEIRYEVLREQYGAENPQARAVLSAVEAAQSKFEAALAGHEMILPVPQTEVPTLARRYAELMQEALIQTEILKFVRPLYEQARFDEQREKVAVQVLDPAVPPHRKAKPKRSLIVIVATLSAGLLAVLYVLLHAWWDQHHTYFASELNRHSRRPVQS